MRTQSLTKLGLLGILMGSCSTTGGKKDGAGGGAGGGDSGDDGSGPAAGGGKDDEAYSTGSFQTFTYSLTNNGLTTYTVNAGKAKSIADDLDAKTANASGKDKKDLIALMASKRLAGEGVVPVFKTAKKLMVVEMQGNIRSSMPEVAMLELALASIHSKQIPMAEHWIEKLLASKNAKTKAAAFTAKGMIALMDNRLPEAIALWNEALKIKGDYEPARLNIGFNALRYGDSKTAKSMLQGLDQDWFIQTGLMQAERIANNPSEAASLCSSILAKKGNYKPALYSCALNEYQGMGNLNKARDSLEKLAKNSGGPSIIDEKVYKTLGEVEKDLLAEQQKAQDAAAMKAAKGQPVPAGGAPGGGQEGAPAPQGQGAPAPQGGQPTPAADDGG